MLHAVSTTIGDEASSLVVNRHKWTDFGFEIELISPHIAREVAPGDVLQAGWSLRHSSLGHFATTIEIFILRLDLQQWPDSSAMRPAGRDQ